MSSYFWMILWWEGEKSCFRVGEGLGNEAGGLGDLDGLGAPLGSDFVKNAAGVGLHRVSLLTKRRAAISRLAEAYGDEAEDFQFARGDAKLGEAGLVGSEGIASLRRDFGEELLTASSLVRVRPSQMPRS